MAGLAIFTWFTINRHRLRELENQALDAPPISAVRYSTSAGDAPPGNSHRVVEDDPDLEIQSSSIGHEVRPSSIGLGIGPSFSGFLGYGESREQPVDHEVGYYVKEPTVASSNGHSSHGNGTIMTRNSSLTHVTGTRNTSPTLPRQSPNRRFTLNPQRGPLPSAWQISRSEAPTRRASIDDASYHPHRVNSDPVVFYDAPPLMSVYPRRQSSEVPRHETFQLPGPIVVHPPLPHPPSSLLRPPSATQIPTIESLQRSSEVYLGLPSVNEPAPSPATSNISILPMREHLLGTPPNHPSSSAPSLRDDYDYCRPLSVGVSAPCLSLKLKPNLILFLVVPGSRCITRQYDYGGYGLGLGDTSQPGQCPTTVNVEVNFPVVHSLYSHIHSLPRHLPLSIQPLFMFDILCSFTCLSHPCNPLTACFYHPCVQHR